MEMVIHEIFPCLIFVVKEFITKEQCKTIFDTYVDKHDMKPHVLLTGDTLSNFDTDKRVDLEIGKLPDLNKFNQDLITAINQYASDIGLMNELDITNSWLNIQNENSRLKKHAHPVSQVSGALYINVDRNSSCLYFHNYNPYLSFSKIFTNTKYSLMEYKIVPEIGDLVLFPSWLSHSSMEDINKTKDRMVFSFNTKFKEEKGDNDE